MGKALCATDKSWLAKATSISKKIASIVDRAKTSVTKMFLGMNMNSAINDTQKSVSISHFNSTGTFQYDAYHIF
jgi:hypothetical protein